MNKTKNSAQKFRPTRLFRESFFGSKFITVHSQFLISWFVSWLLQRDSTDLQTVDYITKGHSLRLESNFIVHLSQLHNHSFELTFRFKPISPSQHPYYRMLDLSLYSTMSIAPTQHNLVARTPSVHIWTLIRYTSAVRWSDTPQRCVDPIHLSRALIRYTSAVSLSDTLPPSADPINLSAVLIRYTSAVRWSDTLPPGADPIHPSCAMIWYTSAVRWSDTEALVRSTTVAANVFVSAVLIGEAAKESLAGHRTRDVRDSILASLVFAVWNIEKRDIT